MASLNDVVAGSSADSSCIQQVIDVMKGTVGAGNIPVSFTAINNSVSFALDVQNLDPVNERTFRARDSSGSARLQVDVSGAQADPTGSGLAPIVNTNATQTLTNKTIGAGTVITNFQTSQCRLTNGSSQTIGSGAATALSWNAEVYDADGMHSTAVNPTRITPSKAGLWGIGGGFAFDPNSSGVVGALLRINSTTYIQAIKFQNISTNAQGTHLSIYSEYQMSTSDYVELCAFQTSGANLGTVPAQDAVTANFWASFKGSS